MTENLNEMTGAKLSRLLTFRLVAQLMSFSLAADRLCITPSAVSHRISTLESDMGLCLFKRSHRKVELTPDGKRLYFSIKYSMDVFEQELADVLNNSESGGLTIYIPSSLAYSWISPFIFEFTNSFPKIKLTILTGNGNININHVTIDVLISYGEEPPKRRHHVLLMEECITPVCSKYYCRDFNLFNKPDNLKNCRLIHDAKAWEYNIPNGEWKYWASHFSIDISSSASIDFDQAELAYIAAINNAGIAMGRKGLVERKLLSGDLITPFPALILKCNRYYYVSTLSDRRGTKVKLFIDWLVSKVN